MRCSMLGLASSVDASLLGSEFASSSLAQQAGLVEITNQKAAWNSNYACTDLRAQTSKCKTLLHRQPAKA